MKIIIYPAISNDIGVKQNQVPTQNGNKKALLKPQSSVHETVLFSVVDRGACAVLCCALW